jgi:hypothetical protein
MFKRGWWYLIAGLVITGLIAGLVITGLPVGSSVAETSRGAAAAATTTVTVDADDPSFTDTGVALTLKEPFSITATGTAKWTLTSRSTGPNGYRFSQFNGVHTCGYDQYHPYEVPSFLAPGLNCWSLVGRIGTAGVIFFVGTSLKMRAPYSGELYLAFNDDYYPNNSGDFVATITAP